MNTAVVKFNKINSTENGFQGYVHTVQEDIVALIAPKATNKPLKMKRRTQFKEEDDEADPPKKKFAKGSPPWLKHFKDVDSNKYKISDTKEFKGKIFHYCDTPNHCDCTKWHIHAAVDCSICKKWLKKQDKDGASACNATEANTNKVTEEDENSDDGNNDELNCNESGHR